MGYDEEDGVVYSTSMDAACSLEGTCGSEYILLIDGSLKGPSRKLRKGDRSTW